MTSRAIGITVALPASLVVPLSPEDLRVQVKDLADQMVPALRHYVGDAPPQGPMTTNLEGPVDDPLQGLIYGLTLAAPFEERDLPSDCDAYRALYGATAPPEPIGYVETTGDGNAP